MTEKSKLKAVWQVFEAPTPSGIKTFWFITADAAVYGPYVYRDDAVVSSARVKASYEWELKRHAGEVIDRRI